MGPELFSGECVEPPIADHRGLDLDRTETQFGPTDRSLGIGAQDPDIGDGSGLGVLTAIVGFHDGDPVVEVKFVDTPGRTLMEVDRSGMHESERTRTIDRSDQCAIGSGDAELVGVGAAQADPVGGTTSTAPHRTEAGACRRWTDLEQVVLHQIPDRIVEHVGPPLLVVLGQGEFEGGTGEMGIEDVGIVDGHDSGLG